MPQELIDSLTKSFYNQKRKGKLRGVELGRYVYGSKAMKNWKAKHPEEEKWT